MDLLPGRRIPPFAFYPLKPYEWIQEEKNWRLRSHHLKNGAGCRDRVGPYRRGLRGLCPAYAAAPASGRRDFDRTLTVSYTSSRVT